MIKDYLLSSLDNSLRTLWGKPHATRPTPMPPTQTSDEPLAPEARALSGALMRVNHVGEVCAQALYTGQALGHGCFIKTSVWRNSSRPRAAKKPITWPGHNSGWTNWARARRF